METEYKMRELEVFDLMSMARICGDVNLTKEQFASVAGAAVKGIMEFKQTGGGDLGKLFEDTLPALTIAYDLLKEQGAFWDFAADLFGFTDITDFKKIKLRRLKGIITDFLKTEGTLSFFSSSSEPLRKRKSA